MSAKRTKGGSGRKTPMPGREVRVLSGDLGAGWFDAGHFGAVDPDSEPDDPELVGLPDDFWEAGVVVSAAFKEPISIRLDADILTWFRAAGPRYQSRINAVLRSYVQHHQRKEG